MYTINTLAKLSIAILDTLKAKVKYADALTGKRTGALKIIGSLTEEESAEAKALLANAS